MLKPMPRKNNNNLILWIIVGVLILAGIITLVSAFSSGDDGLDEVNASYTSAAQTLSVQQLTLQAASPTVTPTLFTPTPSLTPTLFVTNTLPVLVSPTTSTGGTTGGSTAVGCDNSAFVSDVTIPDNTAMIPGQVFKKTWKLQNTGTCPWTTAYKVTFVSGNQMNGVPDPITTEVAPGQSVDVSVSMTASATGGGTGYWILTNASGQKFGTNFYVIINVSGSATTGTTTVTSTTGAPVSTATPTSTTAPTETPTVTPPTP